jgi:hypothetical protein
MRRQLLLRARLPIALLVSLVCGLASGANASSYFFDLRADSVEDIDGASNLSLTEGGCKRTSPPTSVC